ncbi:MAG: sulfotransferase [Acidobacteriaceae bacterium]
MISESTIWPNFFVVGGQKCGTTSIYEHLKKHPQVFVPEKKEPGFFATAPHPGQPEAIVQLRHCDSLEEYEGLYRGAGGFAARGDLSTCYLWDADAPSRIHEICPEAKIIIMLRDPVSRAHSAYLWNKWRCRDTAATFQEALRQDSMRSKANWCTSFMYIECGMYYSQVRRYFETFGRERVMVLLFDDLSRRPQELFAGIADHVGIGSTQFRSADFSEAHNFYKMPRFHKAFRFVRTRFSKELRQRVLPAPVQEWLRSSKLLYGTRKPPLDSESRQYLQAIYEPDVTLLEELLGRKLPELRKSWV